MTERVAATTDVQRLHGKKHHINITTLNIHCECGYIVAVVRRAVKIAKQVVKNQYRSRKKNKNNDDNNNKNNNNKDNKQKNKTIVHCVSEIKFTLFVVKITK